jgi:SAM-dependent methyltransferase
MGSHYGRDYHRVIAAAGETKALGRWRRHRRLISAYKSGGALLDIGCSSGGFLSTMKGSQWTVYGIEIEPSMAERARAVSGAGVYVGDVADAPFANECFDVVTCFDVLEHIHQPIVLLRRALAWLKPGGIFCTVLPNIDSWEANIFGSYWFGLELPRHLVHFSPRSLRGAMERAGFSEVRLTAVGSYAENSARYVFSHLLERLGMTPAPLAKAERPNLAWRAARKAMRAAVISPLGAVASIAGAGASIEAVFSKRA